VNEHLARALELAEKGRGTTHPNPVVGAVVVRDDEVVGEGWHRRKGEPHAEVLALEQAREKAAGSTLYLTMEPCAHHGTMPPCTEAVLAARVSSVVAASLDPNPEAGGGLEILRAAGVEVEHTDLFEARVQNEAWRTWVVQGRPFVTYKAAMTLDGRLTIPGERWISGEESRRLVHELRARSDAVAVGMGTVHADRPRLNARDVGSARQPRRLAFGRGPLPEGSELEVRTGPLADELAALAADGVQSMLLEGGPRIAAAFLREGLLDKLLVFVAPRLAGEGPTLFEGGIPPVRMGRFDSRAVGEDVLLTGYVNEP
jgi:diaminohydroxyphosphoribosylaminopyrimidine deaminase / 5-amino-6-(5-phosphoribosylamino)uracil reductase